MQTSPVYTTCSRAHTLMPTHSHTPMCATHPHRASLTHVTLPSTHMQTGTHPHTTHLHRTSTTTHTSHLCPHSSRLHPHVHTHPPAGGHCPFEPRAPFCRFQAACTCHLALEHLPTSPFPRPCVPVPVSPSHCLSRLAQLPIPKCPSKRSPAL